MALKRKATKDVSQAQGKWKNIKQTEDSGVLEKVATKTGRQPINLVNFDRTHLKKTVIAMSRYIHKNMERKKDLIDEQGPAVHIAITVKNIPDKVLRKHIVLKVPYAPSNYPGLRICIIVRDPEDVWKKIFKEEWDSSKVNGISTPKIIGQMQFRKQFQERPEGRRKLLQSYDLFFCDSRIISYAPLLFGAHFLKAGKLPRRLKLSKNNAVSQVQEALAETTLRIGSGTSLSVKIGHGVDDLKHLYRNALAVITQLSHFFVEKPSPEDGFPSFATPVRCNEIETVILAADNTPSVPLWRKDLQ